MPQVPVVKMAQYLWSARQRLVALLGRFGRGIVQFVAEPPPHIPSTPVIGAATTGADNRTIHEWHRRQAATSTHRRTVPVFPLTLNSLDCAAQQTEEIRALPCIVRRYSIRR